MKFRLTWKRFFAGLGIIVLLLIARPASFLIYVYFNDHKNAKEDRVGYTNDASTLNEIKITERINVAGNRQEAIQQIADLIKLARRTGKKISIAGAAHTMGGHTIFPDAIQLNMKGLNFIQFDSVNDVLAVGAGARWAEVIPYLDKFGKSVAIMQSNNSFTVGGSLSANCHGWTTNAPPIASSVKSFRIINAEGELLTCSRSENAELFSLALGGYGLFGVLIDVDLDITNNKAYEMRQYIITSKDYAEKFRTMVETNPNAGMAYGRLNVNKEKFLEEAILSVYTVTEENKKLALTKNNFAGFRRTVFRGSANSDYGKRLRWKSEKAVTFLTKGKEFSRNQLLNESVEVFENTDSRYTDILQEYFIPVNMSGQFIDSLKKVIPLYKTDLLNITIRDVKKDNDTFLSYANENVFGFVMLFNQQKTEEAENEMKKLTRRLADISISLHGTYYLPYRLHTSREQLRKAYPEADRLFLLKRKYDSLELFQNKFYETYK